jgi:hypothetical protein
VTVVVESNRKNLSLFEEMDLKNEQFRCNEVVLNKNSEFKRRKDMRP